MTYIFRPGGYNVTAAETATITPTFGGAAPFVPGPWYQGPWAADPTVPAIAPAACLIAYQSKWAGGPYTRSDAATYANSLINLANPGTYNAYAGVAPSWTSAGWVFDPATQYLLTGFTPVSGDNDYGYAVAVDQITEVTVIYLFGVQNTVSTNIVNVRIRPVGNQVRFFNGASTGLTIASTSMDAAYGIRHTTGYISTVAQAGSIPAPTGAFGEMAVGKLYFPGLGVQANSAAHRSVAFAAYKPAPTAAQMVQVLTAMEIIRAA